MRGMGIGIGLTRVSPPALAWSDDNLSDWFPDGVTVANSGAIDPETGIQGTFLSELAITGAHQVISAVTLESGKNYRLRVLVLPVGRPRIAVTVSIDGGKYWYGRSDGVGPSDLQNGMTLDSVESLPNSYLAINFLFTCVSNATAYLYLTLSLDPINTFYLGQLGQGLAFGNVKIYEA